MIERLSAIDTAFLQVETDTAHMHVGWVAMLQLPGDGERLDVEARRASIAAKLHLAPRFRKRLVSPPIGEPALVDDDRFRLEHHVRSTPAPWIQADALQGIVDNFLSQQLDRSRPLWEILVVPRLSDGRAAVLGKVHHTLVDGIAAVELGMLLFDLEPHAVSAPAPKWEPQPTPSPRQTTLHAATDAALAQFRDARGLARLGFEPGRALRVAETMRKAAFSLGEQAGRPGPESFLNRPITAKRTLARATLPMPLLAQIKSRADVKLNDVVLAIASGALRRFSEQLGSEPIPLRAMIPISVRGKNDAPASGNRIVLAFVDLPVDRAAPLDRLALITERMDAVKAEDQPAGADMLLRAAGRVPGPIRGRMARLAAESRAFNLTISNVPGPRAPIYATAAKVESIHPVIPITDGHALAIGVLSYLDSLHVAIHANPDVLPEADGLARLFASALDELDRELAAAPGSDAGLGREAPVTAPRVA